MAKKSRALNAAEARKLTEAFMPKPMPEIKVYENSLAGWLEQAFDLISAATKRGEREIEIHTVYQGKRRPAHLKYDDSQTRCEDAVKELKRLGFKVSFGDWELKVLWGDPPSYRPLYVSW